MNSFLFDEETLNSGLNPSYNLKDQPGIWCKAILSQTLSMQHSRGTSEICVSSVPSLRLQPKMLHSELAEKHKFHQTRILRSRRRQRKRQIFDTLRPFEPAFSSECDSYIKVPSKI